MAVTANTLLNVVKTKKIITTVVENVVLKMFLFFLIFLQITQPLLNQSFTHVALQLSILSAVVIKRTIVLIMLRTEKREQIHLQRLVPDITIGAKKGARISIFFSLKKSSKRPKRDKQKNRDELFRSDTEHHNVW